MGWHKGTMSGVRLAAMIAARRAASSTLPFSTFPLRISARVEGFMRIRQVATATRSVRSLAPTSTIFIGGEAPGSGQAVLGHPALGVDGRHAARARGGDRLTVV